MQKVSVIVSTSLEVPNDNMVDLRTCEHSVRYPEILGERTY